MLSFSGWDLYGNSSVVFYNQGIAMLLNMFFGPALNAANNITLTVQGTIKSFAYNVIQAFRPQIIKRYAQGELEAVNSYCVMATQYTLILFSFIAVPVYFNADLILRLWLGIVPDHTVVFLQIVLVGTMFNLANNIINIPLHANGKMKLFSIVTGTCFLAALPLMYTLLKLGASVELSYTVTVISYMSSLISSLLILKRSVPVINLRVIAFNGYLKNFIVLLPSIIVCILLSKFIESKWMYLFTTIFFNTLILSFGLLFIIMSMADRKKLYTLITKKISQVSWFTKNQQ